MSSKQLAGQLAKVALVLKSACGDVRAQALTYGTFLERMGGSRGVDGPTAARELLDDADLEQAFEAYRREGKDPCVYFYEEFLRAYDPLSARTRGVHYSPPAVVSYIVRGVEAILRDSFRASLDQAVLMDPCCGAGTFLRYVETHYEPAPRMIGTELMRPAFEIASRLLGKCELLQADSLDEIEMNLNGEPLVILGNPPYSGHSANAGKIADLMSDYRTGLCERNPKWLQDDYVKFIRMAQSRVDSAGRGIVAFITNHSFLFNPTFRAMRSSLMRSFDEIYLLDLQGNSTRNDARDGEEADENVFPIKMGVAISFMVKSGGSSGCRLHCADLRGTRESKLKALSEMTIDSTPWTDGTPQAPFLLFTPHDTSRQEEFARFRSLFDLFGESSVGFVTSRDRFAVDESRDALLERIVAVAESKLSHEELRAMYPVGDMDIDRLRAEVLGDPDWQSKAVEVLYRPFDRRWAYFTRTAMERPRLPFMENLMGGGNLALAVGRAGQVTGSREWDVVFCTDCPTDLNLFRRGGAMLFPRFVRRGREMVSNVGCEGIDADTLFYYAYALLHGTVYRERYADFLKVDYPRIPVPRTHTTTEALAELGRELVATHLMRNPAVTGGAVETLSVLTGGYEMPRKYIEDRKEKGLSVEHMAHLARMRAAIAQASSIRARIDSLLLGEPPWA